MKVTSWCKLFVDITISLSLESWHSFWNSVLGVTPELLATLVKATWSPAYGNPGLTGRFYHHLYSIAGLQNLPVKTHRVTQLNAFVRIK